MIARKRRLNAARGLLLTLCAFAAMGQTTTKPASGVVFADAETAQAKFDAAKMGICRSSWANRLATWLRSRSIRAR